jgi:hypothetical protein
MPAGVSPGSFKPWSKFAKISLFSKFEHRDSYPIGGKSGTAHHSSLMLITLKENIIFDYYA